MLFMIMHSFLSQNYCNMLLRSQKTTYRAAFYCGMSSLLKRRD